MRHNVADYGKEVRGTPRFRTIYIFPPSVSREKKNRACPGAKKLAQTCAAKGHSGHVAKKQHVYITGKDRHVVLASRKWAWCYPERALQCPPGGRNLYQHAVTFQKFNVVTHQGVIPTLRKINVNGCDKTLNQRDMYIYTPRVLGRGGKGGMGTCACMFLSWRSETGARERIRHVSLLRLRLRSEECALSR